MMILAAFVVAQKAAILPAVQSPQPKLARSEKQRWSLENALTLEADGSVAVNKLAPHETEKTNGKTIYEVDKDATLQAHKANQSVAIAAKSTIKALKAGQMAQTGHVTSNSGSGSPVAAIVADTVSALSAQAVTHTANLATYAQSVANDLIVNGRADAAELAAEIEAEVNRALEVVTEVATEEIDRLKLLAQESVEALFQHGEQAVKIVLECGYDAIHDAVDQSKAGLVTWAETLDAQAKACLAGKISQSACPAGCTWMTSKLVFKCRMDPAKKKEINDACTESIAGAAAATVTMINQTAHEQVQLLGTAARLNVTHFMTEVNTSIHTFKSAVLEEVGTVTQTAATMINETITDLIDLGRSSVASLTSGAEAVVNDIDTVAREDTDALNAEIAEENQIVVTEGNEIAD